MNYSEIEKAIVKRLTTHLPEYDISIYPNNPIDYEMLHPNGSILVKYRNSQYNSPSIQMQALLINFDIYLLSKLDRSEGLDLLEKIRQILTSDFFIDNTRFYITSEGQDDFINGIWYYTLQITLPYLTLQGY